MTLLPDLIFLNLNLYNNEIYEIKGLEDLKNLKVLILKRNQIPEEMLVENKFNFEIKAFDFKRDDIY